jgi:hypothetical protein
MLAGMTALFIYLLPDNEGMVATLGVVISIWQGILLLKAEPGETQASLIKAESGTFHIQFTNSVGGAQSAK